MTEAKALAAKARAAHRLAAANAADGTQGAALRPGPGRGRGRAAVVPPPSTIPSRLDGGWKGGAENRRAPPPPDRKYGTNGTTTSASGVEGAGVGAKVKAAPKEEKLHPSWEAKKRLKEKEQIGILPAQGKKIKF